ncbi:bifunctional aspartate kinase/homoserine dehydrogenase II [Thalassotalea sp. PP2-459]|uniref:bifunctional aspartate kinase/homoserine dehydrogenase II n=1 Tax=Thalassotalea sp. PP2-459 TaxID=1742724 RepID=UPI00096847DC|nr:bifunctional aspartate kinase/homoserine dehydrogenase II [Thalassotalea sp. PP2-459]OKY26851.1 aspartate kinase [Thalassotalea sp. PP2-459]
MNQTNVIEQFSADNNQLAKHATNVHKFGGSSLASVQCIERVVDIIRQHCQINDVIVVSANGDTTDALFEIYHQALKQKDSLSTKILALQEQQASLINQLLNAASAARLTMLLAEDIEQITQWMTTNPEQYEADLLAYGEVWSARLLSSVLSETVCPSYYLDARDFLVINNQVDCFVERDESLQQFKECLKANQLAIVTGYICKDIEGKSCTLGRNGSDYSATILASFTAATNVTLWTDVDGIYSADPRVVPQARKLHRLPNGVAKELGRLGNPVLHAKTLQPITATDTHLHVASSFDPDVPGTEIGKFGQIAKQELSVTYTNDLILAQSESFVGDSGIQAERVFNALGADTRAGFIVIKQEQQKGVSQWLAAHDTEVSFTPCAILAVVGHNVVEQGQVKARFKRALRHQSCFSVVNSQSAHSLIAILINPCTTELLNNVHHEMTKDARHIGMVVAGLGNIGQRFLEMLPAQLTSIAVLENVHLVGLISSRKALVNTDGIEVNQALELFAEQAQSYDNELLFSWLSNHPYDELIVVDITPSESFSQLYLPFFQRGIHIIGANKWAASSPTEEYQCLVDTSRDNKSIWLGNTTVGAGLPVNYAIEDLNRSGDNITELSGIFSGTLSWLFQTYDGSVPFSTLLLDALAQGITEPDPREDLSGRDVQRKLLILARAAGFNLSLSDISRQDLVPDTLQSLSTQEFLASAEQLDTFFAQALDDANNKNACIRYIANFSADQHGKLHAEVKLAVLPNTHAFANLTPCDNIFQIKSGWYQDNPLIIRGPGAGRDVTAGGLHSDLVAMCQQLVNRRSVVKLKGIEENNDV